MNLNDWRELKLQRKRARFLTDKDGRTLSQELDCLRPHVGTLPILESIPPHLPRDIYICPLHNIIGGPLLVTPIKRNKWEIPNYDELKRKFERTVKIKRQIL